MLRQAVDEDLLAFLDIRADADGELGVALEAIFGRSHASIKTCPGSRGDAVKPRTDRRVRLEREAALVGAVRVRVQRDVRDRHRVTREPVAPVKAELERRERFHAAFRQMMALRLPDLRPRRVRLEEARDRDRRLVLVLLEEHPLERLRAVVAVLRDEPRALSEVRDDRVRLRERAAVVEDERRRVARRIERGELLRGGRCGRSRRPRAAQAGSRDGPREAAPCSNCPRSGCCREPSRASRANRRTESASCPRESAYATAGRSRPARRRRRSDERPPRTDT